MLLSRSSSRYEGSETCSTEAEKKMKDTPLLLLRQRRSADRHGGLGERVSDDEEEWQKNGSGRSMTDRISQWGPKLWILRIYIHTYIHIHICISMYQYVCSGLGREGGAPSSVKKKKKKKKNEEVPPFLAVSVSVSVSSGSSSCSVSVSPFSPSSCTQRSQQCRLQFSF